jgi:hypothetical protein
VLQLFAYTYYYDVLSLCEAIMSNAMHVRISENRHDAKSTVPNDKAYMPNGLRRIKQS